MDVSAGKGTVRPVPGKLRSAGKPSSPRRRKRPARRAIPSGFGGYLAATRHVGISLVLTLPLLVLYNLGELFPSTRMTNGLDLLTRLVSTNWGMFGVLIMNLAIGFVSIALAYILVKAGRIRPWHWLMLLFEGVLWALVLGGLGYIAANGLNRPMLPGSWTVPQSGFSVGQILTASAGAGYWEEAFFRLLLVGLFMWPAMKFVQNRKGTWPVKALFATTILCVSAFLFALAHYIGPGEELDTWSFTFRFVSGLLFGLLFLFRGFSTVAYSHFVYDVIVFWLIVP